MMAQFILRLVTVHIIMFLILTLEHGDKFLWLFTIIYVGLFIIYFIVISNISSELRVQSIHPIDIANKGLKLAFNRALPLAGLGIVLRIIHIFIPLIGANLLGGIACNLALLLLIYLCPYSSGSFSAMLFSRK